MFSDSNNESDFKSHRTICGSPESRSLNPNHPAPHNAAAKRSFLRIAAVFVAAVLILASLQLPPGSLAANLIIVLDPGHGGTDPGAGSTVDGKAYNEKDCNLTIARSVKKYLEEYNGVTVLMTCEGNETLTLAQRVSRANRFGANVLVSIHNNSSDGKARGTVVVAANSTFRPEITAMTQTLGNNILASVNTIGLQNHDLLTTMANTATYKEYYPDGSLQDYYGIVMRSMRAGFPGIIVECCFIDNPDDVRDFLSSNEKMDKVGLKIAEGIAKTYNLSKETAVSVEARHPVDGSSLSFADSYARNLFFPQEGTTMSGTEEAVFTRSGGPRVYLDYMGMAVNTSDFSHAIITMKGASGGEKLKLFVGDELITVPRDDFSYEITLSAEYKTYVIDFTRLPVWDKAFNFFKFVLSGGDSFSVKSLAFHPAGDSCSGAVLPENPTPTPTKAPTPTPTATPTPTPSPTPTAAPTVAPTEAPTDTPAPAGDTPESTDDGTNATGASDPALPSDTPANAGALSPSPSDVSHSEASEAPTPAASDPSGGSENTVSKKMWIVMLAVTAVLLVAVFLAAIGGKGKGKSKGSKKQRQ